jgi:hypothetical protein
MRKGEGMHNMHKRVKQILCMTQRMNKYTDDLMNFGL